MEGAGLGAGRGEQGSPPCAAAIRQRQEAARALALAPGLETIVARPRLRDRHAVSDRAGAAGAGQALGPAAPLF